MNKNIKIILGIMGLLIVGNFIISIVGLVGVNQLSQLVNSEQLGSGTRMLHGLSTDSTAPSTGEVRTTTLTVTSTGSIGGLFTLNAGQLRSHTNATTTTLSTVMIVSDVQGYDTILVSPAGATSNKTLTFFASSTASAWLPTAGDMQETCFVNATTAAAATITFAAGTGIDLEVATTTSATDLTIAGGNTACFKFIRQPATTLTFDITAAMIEYTNGD